jgi:hypothetical protein
LSHHFPDATVVVVEDVPEFVVVVDFVMAVVDITVVEVVVCCVVVVVGVVLAHDTRIKDINKIPVTANQMVPLFIQTSYLLSNEITI